MKYLRLTLAVLITALFMYLIWVDSKKDFMDVAFEVKKEFVS